MRLRVEAFHYRKRKNIVNYIGASYRDAQRHTCLDLYINPQSIDDCLKFTGKFIFLPFKFAIDLIIIIKNPFRNIHPKKNNQTRIRKTPLSSSRIHFEIFTQTNPYSKSLPKKGDLRTSKTKNNVVLLLFVSL